MQLNNVNNNVMITVSGMGWWFCMFLALFAGHELLAA